MPSPRVFLSASVPSVKRDKRYLSGPVEPKLMARIIETRVRDAVASFVVQLLRAGGQLVFGGHPKIVPIVAGAAGNFFRREGEHFPVLLYQSAYFRDDVPPVGREEMEKSGIARVNWVPSDPEEAAKTYSIKSPYLDRCGEFKGLYEGQHDNDSQRELSSALAVMRVVMILDGQAQTILSMGGMEGISAEAKLFHEIRQKGWSVGPVHFSEDTMEGTAPRETFALRSTYGAAKVLDSANFIDEDYFGQRPSALRRGPEGESLLEPARKMELTRMQLMERIRYDRMMTDFVKSIAGSSRQGK